MRRCGRRRSGSTTRRAHRERRALLGPRDAKNGYAHMHILGHSPRDVKETAPLVQSQKGKNLLRAATTLYLHTYMRGRRMTSCDVQGLLTCSAPPGFYRGEFLQLSCPSLGRQPATARARRQQAGRQTPPLIHPTLHVRSDGRADSRVRAAAGDHRGDAPDASWPGATAGHRNRSGAGDAHGGHSFKFGRTRNYTD